MWGRLKLRLLKAAFAERDDVDVASTTAWEATERIAATYFPHADAETQFDASFDAYLAVYDAIKRYQVLRAGPPEPPWPAKPRETPRRPIRERGRAALLRLADRVRMAVRVLVLGHRPATVRYDALDRRIAENCAFALADVIAGRFVPPQRTMEDDDHICGKIACLVVEAIEGYVTYTAESETLAWEQLAREEENRRTREVTEYPEIPF